MSVATWVTCTTCGRHKAPLGRSVAHAMADSLCFGRRRATPASSPAGCPGYYEAPRPDCRWPGEEQCGPGCNKG